jgi:hypothetical protein
MVIQFQVLLALSLRCCQRSFGDRPMTLLKSAPNHPFFIKYDRLTGRLPGRVHTVLSENSLTLQINQAHEQIVSRLGFKTYKSGDTEQKRHLIGSVFPEKFSFENFKVRTARLNEVVRLIYTLDAGFGGNENGTSAKKIDLSREVGLPGFEPRQTEPKSVVLPLYYRPPCFPLKGMQK